MNVQHVFGLLVMALIVAMPVYAQSDSSTMASPEVKPTIYKLPPGETPPLKEVNAECKADVEAMKAAAEEFEACTMAVYKMRCDVDDSVFYPAMNGCEADFLQERGWEKVTSDPRPTGKPTNPPTEADPKPIGVEVLPGDPTPLLDMKFAMVFGEEQHITFKSSMKLVNIDEEGASIELTQPHGVTKHHVQINGTETIELGNVEYHLQLLRQDDNVGVFSLVSTNRTLPKPIEVQVGEETVPLSGGQTNPGKQILISKSGEQGSIIEQGGVKARVAHPIVEKNNQYYVEIDSIERPVRVFPQQVQEQLEAETKAEYENIELTTADDKAVYIASGTKDGKAFGVINVKMQYEAAVDAETGEVEEVRKPWYAFLVAE